MKRSDRTRIGTRARDKARRKRSRPLFALCVAGATAYILCAPNEPPRLTTGGAYLMLRERRAGAMVVDFRTGGAKVAGSVRGETAWADPPPTPPGGRGEGRRRLTRGLSTPVPLPPGGVRGGLGPIASISRSSSYVLLGDTPASRRFASARLEAGSRVLLVPAPLLEARDIPGVTSVEPREFARRLKATPNSAHLDFSEREEFGAARVPGARHVPTSQLLSGDRTFLPRGTKTVFVSCAAGHRSRLAARLLMREGVRVVNLRGGVLKWEASGLALESDSARERR